MSEYDLIVASLPSRSVLVEAAKLTAVRSVPREQAIETGRLLGVQAALEARETGAAAASRVARARAYAAWEWDGKPMGQRDRYRDEFGLTETNVVESGSRS